MKVCVDCKYAAQQSGAPMCAAPQNSFVNLVTGKSQYVMADCKLHREMGWALCRMLKTCGKEGRWFEPKDSEIKE